LYDGTEVIGQLCQGTASKILLWKAPKPTNDHWHSADWDLCMYTAHAYMNEPEWMYKLLRKLEKPAGQYALVLWNMPRGAEELRMSFDFEG
jgi:hypothetical protein